tara:strand:- start:197 stop:901 length:705 start_codon:yes stop_codon:yes gene_type:complete
LEHWRDALVWDPVALFTVILGISTIGLWLATKRLWKGAEAQARDLTRSADAALISAQAAADAAKIAYAAARPWIQLHVSKAHLYFNEDNQTEVGCQLNYSIKNIGQTPAIELRVVFKPVPVGRGSESDIELELRSLKNLASRNPRVLFPSDKIEEGFSTNFPFPNQADESMLGFKVVVAVLYKAALDGQEYWTPAVLGLQHETPPQDRVHRFYRGMGNVPCLVMRLGDETPQPT